MSSSSSQKRPHPSTSSSQPPSQTPLLYKSQQIHLSTPIHDRSSTFIALFSSSPLFLSNPTLLQSYPDFATASHRILAWRRSSSYVQRSGQTTKQQTTLSFASGQRDANNSGSGVSLQQQQWDIGSDEDGETYAGKKVENVLKSEGVEGVVCVGRWFGGVLLGPVRFKWIEDVVREVVGIARVGGALGGGGGDWTGTKRLKTGDAVVMVEDEEAQKREKERLARVLGERDGTILVLRGLLGEKMEGLERMERREVAKQASDVTGSNDGDRNDTTKYTGNGDDVETATTTQRNGDQDITTTSSASPADTAKESRQQPTPPPSSLPPPVKAPQSSLPDYSTMALDRLKQLEKARDATIGWILKQIDVVEEKIKIKQEAAKTGVVI